MACACTPPVDLRSCRNTIRGRRHAAIFTSSHAVEASDGAEALEVASAYARPIDLLLTDVIMPRVNGLLLAQGMLQEWPGIRVLYMSGYVEKSLLVAKHPESILLQKPFTPETLVAAVRQVFASKEQP